MASVAPVALDQSLCQSITASALESVTPATDISTLPGVIPAGTVTVICVLESNVGDVTGWPPITTACPDANPVPPMTATSPAITERGVTVVTVTPPPPPPPATLVLGRLPTIFPVRPP